MMRRRVRRHGRAGDRLFARSAQSSRGRCRHGTARALRRSGAGERCAAAAGLGLSARLHRPRRGGRAACRDRRAAAARGALQGLHRTPPGRSLRHLVRLRRPTGCCRPSRCRRASSRCARAPRHGWARRPRRWSAPSSPSTGPACRSAGIATFPTSRTSSASRSPARRGCAFAAIRRCSRKRADVLSLELAPRSAYLLRAEARWGWQHSVAPTPALRYSITFRTRRAGRRGSRPAAASTAGHAGRRSRRRRLDSVQGEPALDGGGDAGSVFDAGAIVAQIPALTRTMRHRGRCLGARS